MLVRGFSLGPLADLTTRLVGDIPAIPVPFVNRPEIDAALEKALNSESASDGAVALCAVQGLPGIGKTTQAAHLARQLAARRAFRDGIFWITIGPPPRDILRLVEGMIQEVENRPYRAVTLQAAAGHLKELLRPKKALIIVDDVWDPAHAQPFLADGRRCRVLITTRDASVAKALNAPVHYIGVMLADEALSLFSSKLGRVLTTEEEGWVLKLYELLGGLPLALALAASQLGDGVTWTELLSGLSQEIARLDILEPAAIENWDPQDQRTRSVVACFGLSIRRLSSELIQAFAWLGVLRKSVGVMASQLTALWGVDESAALWRLRYFSDQALLIPGASTDDGRGYRIHDLMHDLAKSLIVARLSPGPGAKALPGLELTLQEAHCQFLDRHLARAVGGSRSWPEVPDDGYLYQNLDWHLEKAGRRAELFDLIEAPALARGRRWYDACERQENISVFISMVDNVRLGAEENYRNRADPAALALSIRCALLLTSISSMASMFPELVASLVAEGLWSIDHALTYVRRVAADWRIVALRSLVKSAPLRTQAELLREIIELTFAVDPELPYRHLLRIAPYLAGREELVESILRRIDHHCIQPDWIRLCAKLLPLVNPERAAQFASKKRPFIDHDPSYRKWAYAVLAPFTDPALLESAIESARVIDYLNHRALALAYLAKRLTGDRRAALVREALEAHQAVKYEFDWAEFIAEIDSAFSAETLDSTLLVYSRLAERDSTIESYLADALAELAPSIAGEAALLERAWDAVRSLTDSDSRWTGLVALATHAPEPARSRILEELEVLSAAEASIYNQMRRKVDIARLMPVEKRHEMLLEVRRYYLNIGDYHAYYSALHRVIEHTEPEERTRIAQQVLSSTDLPERNDAIAVLGRNLQENDPTLRSAVQSLAPGVTVPVHEARLSISQAVAAENERIPLVRAAWAAIEKQSDEVQGDALIDLASRVPIDDALAAELFEPLRSLSDFEEFARVLEAFFPRFPEDQQVKLLIEGVSFMRRMQDDFKRKEIGARIASLAQERPDVIRGSWEEAKSIADAGTRVLTLLEILPLLNETEAALRAAELYPDVQGITDSKSRAAAKARLMRFLSPADAQTASSAAIADEDSETWHESIVAVAGFAPYLPLEQRSAFANKLIGHTPLIAEEDYIADALAAIAKAAVLDEAGLQSALAIARRMTDPQNRAAAIGFLLPHAAPTQRAGLFGEALKAVRLVAGNESWRVWLTLNVLLPNCPEDDRLNLLQEALLVLLESEISVDTFYMRRIVNSLRQFTKSNIQNVLLACLQVLVNRKRQLLLQFLGAASPLLETAHGTEGNAAIARVLTEVVGNFP